MTNENIDKNDAQDIAHETMLPAAGKVLLSDKVLAWRVLNRGYKLIRDLLRRQHDQFAELAASVQRQTLGFEQCLNTVRNCQEQTAKILNHELDRHALTPAIESVVLLAGEIEHLTLAARVFKDSEPCGKVRQVLGDLTISWQIAQDRLRYLDIERILPSVNDSFDPKLHAIVSYSPTEEASRVGCISELITAGIIYRGKVLRPARVSVFRKKQ